MLTLKEINKKILSIGKSGKTLDDNIHLVGVSILNHASEHGDFSAMNRLISAMPKSARTQALIKWVVDHSPLYHDVKTNLFIKSKNNKTEYNVEQANDIPFWEYTIEKVVVPNYDNILNFQNILNSVEKAIDKADGADTVKGDRIMTQQRLSQFRAFVSDLQAS